VYILYVDESGDPANPDEQTFVLGGIAVFERQTHWLSQQMDALEVEVFGPPPGPGEVSPIARPVEFHASSIYSRRDPPWDALGSPQSAAVLRKLADLVADCHETCALFAVVVHRPSYPDEDPIVFAFNELVRRFDLYLVRRHNQGDTQRGLMVFDESRHETRLQTLLRSYTVDGGPFGRLRNMADVPFFADSRSSRLLQLADFIAWATFRRYERGVATHFDRIVGRFDAENHRLHGLYHKTRQFHECFCPGCFSRRAAGA
jgi:hypothetical protein